MDTLAFAKIAAQKAGETTLKYFKKEHDYHHKGEASNFATEADLASEKVIFNLLKKHFPKHNFLSEEMGMVDNNSDYTWVADPIDGTVNFSHGQVLWGVELALFFKSEPIIGVVYLPILNELFYTQKGKGAFLNGRKIRVSAEADIEKSLMGIETAYPSGRKLQKFPFELFIRNIPSVLGLSLSTAYDLAALADARIDGFVEEITCIWDIGAGALLVEEAGGKITDWKGKPIKWELGTDKHYSTIASNGILHKEIISRLKSYL